MLGHIGAKLGQLRKYRALLNATELLLIDDMFLRKLPAHAGDELADVLMGRYENASTIITSNRPIDDWTRLLGDVVVVTPLLPSHPSRPPLEARGQELASERSRGKGCQTHLIQPNSLRPAVGGGGVLATPSFKG